MKSTHALGKYLGSSAARIECCRRLINNQTADILMHPIKQSISYLPALHGLCLFGGILPEIGWITEGMPAFLCPHRDNLVARMISITSVIVHMQLYDSTNEVMFDIKPRTESGSWIRKPNVAIRSENANYNRLIKDAATDAYTCCSCTHRAHYMHRIINGMNINIGILSIYCISGYGWNENGNAHINCM